MNDVNSGIYYIINKINNNIYIGCTTNFNNRENQHFAMLKHNKHHSKYLQNAYNKYGNSNFGFTILDRIDNLNLLYKIEDDFESQYVDFKPKKIT